MSIKRPAILAAAILSSFLVRAPGARAQERPGVTAAPVLQIPVGARAVGMGTAFAAVASDVSTLHYNPAGLATLNYREATFMYLRSVEDQNVEYMAVGSPLPFAGFTGAGYASAGASLLLTQNGTIQVNRTLPDGSFQDSRTLDAGGDLAASLAYAERLADTPLEAPNQTVHFNHFLGVSGKFIRSTLAETAQATAFAADVGYLLRVPELGWSFGASMANLGGKMRFVEEGDPLPLTFRAGTAYEWREPTFLSAVTAAADWEYQYYERQFFVNTGLEYTALKHYSARLGYRIHRDDAGLTVGFGAKWGPWVVDYAWGLNDALSDTHRFSFSFQFGGVPVREREKARRPFIENVPEREQLRDREQERPNPMDRPTTPRRSTPDSQKGAPGWIY